MEDIIKIKICKKCKYDTGKFPCQKGYNQVRNVANNCKDFDGELYNFNRSKAKIIYPSTWQ